ncbi:hypothetical protein ACPCSP_20665 [Streptomyces cinereoruber]|uniref:hypothetical protein n=1 Tax=Streptomyces TaxID=1883 RepID=UPI000787F346|nr:MULTISPECIES: hypothetical protein [unclassified Streptomyces]AVH94292.1 hypothetical protein C5L38_03795 [Streptomyces sp. WAC00288]KYG51284.1 hypothetical protein AWI43_27915 [Streptomyces sp. WAC04657]PVC76108.1 hypothetical protein DBP18_05005 [Streptomyces sp. CS081A]
MFSSRDTRVLVTINALPLAVGVLLSCSTTLGEISLYGRLTLATGWALAQLVVLVGGVWWYETRAASSGEPAPTTASASQPTGGTR